MMTQGKGNTRRDDGLARFAAAIFDLDGTVTDSSLLHLRTFNGILARYGVEIPQERWLSLYEGTGSRHIFEDVLAKHGLLGKVDLDSLLEERQERFKELALLQLIPVKGFARFFDELRAYGVASIIATNGHEKNVRLSLEILKIDEEPRVTAEEAGKAKPDPAVYLLACRRLGRRPEECVVFEDSVSGVVAAKRTGCYCVCVETTTTRERLEAAGADLVVKDFTKLTPSLLFASGTGRTTKPATRTARIGDARNK